MLCGDADHVAVYFVQSVDLDRSSAQAALDCEPDGADASVPRTRNVAERVAEGEPGDVIDRRQAKNADEDWKKV